MIHIIVGSMLGGTEYVAEACQELLEQKNREVTLHLTPKFSEIPHKNQTWLICTSTHGAGEYPDNFKPFVQALAESDLDLSTTQLVVIGIGDRSYDTFCLAAKNIEKLLVSMGCKTLFPAKLYDMQEELDPEEDAPQWLASIIDQL